MSQYVENILFHYLSATDAEYEEGYHWYDRANLAVRSVTDDVWMGAGVFAAYSINNGWNRNYELAMSSLESGTPRTDALSVSVDKARRIMAGEEPLAVLNGPKVKAFCAAIADPHNSTIATIDRHARDVAFNRVVGPKVKIAKGLFHELSDAYVEAAELTGEGVAALQAICWVRWKNLKGVR